MIAGPMSHGSTTTPKGILDSRRDAADGALYNLTGALLLRHRDSLRFVACRCLVVDR
jgi:hypothetical protein